MVYENHLWHISYAIKLWLNVVMEGIYKGLMIVWWTKEKSCEVDYGTVGLDFVGSGREGVTFIAPWKMVKTICIYWVWSLCSPFGFSSGCLCGFKISRAMQHGAIVFPFSYDRYALNLVFQH